MGCNSSSESKSSDKIDKQLYEEKKSQEREIKLLLLGSGDSGKSTIAKQMRYIHTKGFTSEEIDTFVEIMHSNVLSSIQILIRNCSTDELGDLKERADYYSEINPYELPLTPDIGSEIDRLWKHESIQKLFNNKRAELNLPEVTSYCLDQVERISSETYAPTQEDILRCRQRTTGMKETVFNVQDIKFRLIDVGGQKNERRKWIHYFEDVKTIIFCVALGDYDMNLVEDETINRMEDSLKLWTDIVNNPFFKSTSFVLFLNKNDIFREKIKKIPLSVAFPDYQGGLNYDKGIEYVRNKFFASVPTATTIVAHVTTATDTENITIVFDAVRRNILQSILKINF
ncbi:G-protein subunit alpha 9 [Dictyostelium purpureum]|uniref:G-protein subunit alpha 9 n=1 Tax=Dictyostelium purpureum TaxID=5786 RepID=F0ZRJ1_DICPU|nr:G-protein subunit alpha 9 [Dictyostelium purpureum]EGC33464.1 G-protein subunit alpha 9 [Dictyostelium purpureum]|eukprot:XP_003290035.1 G-protein subunit alpha 9 [Dictyostelium purpureum]